MKYNNFLTLILVPLFLVCCGKFHNNTGPSEKPTPGFVKTQVELSRVGSLHKSSAESSINLSKLILMAVSTATPVDTVNDTSIVSGNAQITVTRILTLSPLRTWSISAKSVDILDSVIHSGTTTSFYVRPADTSYVSLTLNSKFTMYEANFMTFPDSISSSTAGTGKDKLNLNRVSLKVDGIIKGDSNLTPSFFLAGQSVKVTYDYVNVGSHVLVLEVYGVLHNFSGVLYRGTVTVNVASGIDDTQLVNLAWVGPTTGTSKMTVILGKVGKVTVNGSLPGTVIP